MKVYHDLLNKIIDEGEHRQDRTGVGTINIFGHQMQFDLQEGFPAITTKKLAWRSVVAELLWILEGSCNERRLAELTYRKPRKHLEDKRTIWVDNFENQGKSMGYTDGDLGPIYGTQLRYFNSEDQLAKTITGLKEYPYSRRHVITLWNPADLARQALPCCHGTVVQFYASNNKLSCQMYQRSADAFLGVPFNIASYALLTHIIARHLGMGVGKFIHTLGDAHIYKNHLPGVVTQLSRDDYPLPQLLIQEDFGLLFFGEYPLNSVDNFKLLGYKYHPTIKAPMAI